MRLGLVSLAAALIGTVLPVRTVSAMQFERVEVANGEVMISGRGPIVRGDGARLERALATVAPAEQLLGLALDSPGGTVMDGADMARIIHDQRLAVVIPTNSKCTSACILMLAAAPRRLVAENALVGVHGASDDGKDTEVAMAMTTAMARAAAELGVPPAIIGKMVETVPSRVEWLTHADLNSMGVIIYDDVDASVVTRRSTSPVVTRELPQPGSCGGTGGGGGHGEFTIGCEAAKPRFVAADDKSHVSADDRTSWTIGHPAVSNEVRTDAVFQGALYCKQGPTRLTLRLLPTHHPQHRRAFYNLDTPIAGDPPVAGVATIEGRLDLAGGMIDLRPVAEAGRAGSFGQIGLQGRSDDGGRTFTGHVTANPHCTSFTLTRAD
jgi:hypothetical protein